MDSLKFRRLAAWVYGLTLFLFGGAVYQGVTVYRLEALNQAIAHPGNIIIDDHTPPILIFDKAMHLNQTGKAGEAIRLYASLRNTPEPDLRARAFHNLAGIYLRDGAQHWNAHGVLDYARVSTEVELAKQNYREALRLNPDDWDARYNLEYAWRITPPPKEKPKADFQGTKSSVYSTLPGLPGGGP
jgi:mxaK protein